MNSFFSTQGMKVISSLTVVSVIFSHLALFFVPTSHPDFDPSPKLSENNMQWSMPAEPLLILQSFLIPDTFSGPAHRGIDISVSPDTDIVSPASGIVLFHGPVAGRDVMTIDHFDGIVSTLDPVSSTLAVGEAVEKGQHIGTVQTDALRPHCKPHLCIHFGVRLNGKYINPLFLIEGKTPSVLYAVKSPILL